MYLYQFHINVIHYKIRKRNAKPVTVMTLHVHCSGIMCITVIVSSWHIGTDLTVLNKLLVLVKHILSNNNEKIIM